MPFMLDTSAINRILDRAVENEWPPRGDIFVTDIQFQEILDTRDPTRRNFLFKGLMSLRPNVIGRATCSGYMTAAAKISILANVSRD
jgi:hypothetical protein